jgi:tetratricopeptide (TPR) repeat protein
MTVFRFNHVPLAEVTPDDPALQFSVNAESLCQAGNYSQANSSIQKAIDLASVVSAIQNPLRAYLPHFLVQKAKYLMHAGENDFAIRVLQEALLSLELWTGSDSHEDAIYIHEFLVQAHTNKIRQIATKIRDERREKASA